MVVVNVHGEFRRFDRQDNMIPPLNLSRSVLLAFSRPLNARTDVVRLGSGKVKNLVLSQLYVGSGGEMEAICWVTSTSFRKACTK